MSVKETVIQGIRKVSPLTTPFFDTMLSWAQKHRELRFLLPPGKQFIYDQYLGNLKVNIDTTYPIEVEMATGRYDLKTSDIIQKFISADDTVLDIGANVGALTLLMATVADQGRVIAIEPGPNTFARLQANLDLNPILSERIDIYQLGIADKPGVLYWQEDANVPGNAGLFSHDGLAVKVESLDQFVNQLSLNHLDFLKIDVEGMEYEVISGGLDVLSTFRPIIYYETLESFRVNRGFDIYNQIFDVLKRLDYRQFAIARNAQIQEVLNLDRLLSPNTLAIPSEKYQHFSMDELLAPEI